MAMGGLLEGSRNGSRWSGVIEPRASDHSGCLISVRLIYFIEVYSRSR